ncbi:dATP/dGTP diphosphohydrolase domain-containing protein [Dyella silvatica]|uniref:dATP/dGTP diphosphohydrolase domain-containing protein n=1 Tax=Dyella silvatica TaxID=2992128 RepID=UPI00224DFDA7|nr:dATP/dGTP diphosphohydrolase domain-containing protein [Dyella silvatica]
METPVNTGIGDVTSDARGSGARFNTGKVPYELLPLKAFFKARAFPTRSMPERIMEALAAWQTGEDNQLRVAMLEACYGVMDLPNLADAAKVFDYGRKKYAEWNWAKGMPWSAPMACAIRHCLAILDGEENDPESGLPHLAHVKCNLLMLLTFTGTYPEGDDRPVRWLKAANS